MLMMDTMMLSCDAIPKEYCSGLEDECTESRCKVWCAGMGYTKGSHCQWGGVCCCVTATMRKVDVVHPID
ncbi:hypothetical protein VPH35_112790 [Triticum aestivum]